MRDRDVRQALTENLRALHDGAPDTHIRHELGLEHGQVFVDVVVINGELHGYELKSDSDTLDRLPRQVQAYSAVLDKATLVVEGQPSADFLHGPVTAPAQTGCRVEHAQADAGRGN